MNSNKKVNQASFLDRYNIVLVLEDGNLQFYNIIDHAFKEISSQIERKEIIAISDRGQYILLKENDANYSIMDSTGVYTYHLGKIFKTWQVHEFLDSLDQLITIDESFSMKTYNLGIKWHDQLTSNKNIQIQPNKLKSSNCIITSFENEPIIIWNYDTHQIIELEGSGGYDYSNMKTLITDNSEIVLAQSSNLFMLWDKSGQPLFNKPIHFNGIRKVEFIPNSDKILFQSYDSAWLTNYQGELIIDFELPYWTFQSVDVKYTPDGKSLISTSDEGISIIWDLEGNRLSEFDSDFCNYWFSNDGRLILTQNHHEQKLWDRLGNQYINYCGSYGDEVYFPPDESNFFTITNNDSITICDSIGKLINKLYAPDIESIAGFFPSQRTFIALSKTGIPSLWSYNGVLIQELQNRGIPVTGIVLSNDKTKVAAIVGNNIEIWDSEGNLLAEMIGHNDQILDVQFSKNDSLLFTRSKDATYSIWTIQGSLIDNLSKSESISLKSAFPTNQGDRIIYYTNNAIRVCNNTDSIFKLLNNNSNIISNLDGSDRTYFDKENLLADFFYAQDYRSLVQLYNTHPKSRESDKIIAEILKVIPNSMTDIELYNLLRTKNQNHFNLIIQQLENGKSNKDMLKFKIALTHNTSKSDFISDLYSRYKETSDHRILHLFNKKENLTEISNYVIWQEELLDSNQSNTSLLTDLCINYVLTNQNEKAQVVSTKLETLLNDMHLSDLSNYYAGRILIMIANCELDSAIHYYNIGIQEVEESFSVPWWFGMKLRYQIERFRNYQIDTIGFNAQILNQFETMANIPGYFNRRY